MNVLKVVLGVAISCHSSRIDAAQLTTQHNSTMYFKHKTAHSCLAKPNAVLTVMVQMRYHFLVMIQFNSTITQRPQN